MWFVIGVGLFVLWAVAICWLIVECYGWMPKVLAFFLFVIPFGIFLHTMHEYDQKFPCVQYETRLQFNAATKTMMPMRVCVMRGEWVD